MELINVSIVDGIAEGFHDSEGNEINPATIGETEETYYMQKTLNPLCIALQIAGVTYRRTARGAVMRVGQARVISLDKWRISDFSVENLKKLESRFGGELPPAIGFAVARKLPFTVSRDTLLEREAVLMSDLYENDYLSAYRAGIISNMTRNGELVTKLQSWDISSAYPAALLEMVFPKSDSAEVDPEGKVLTDNGTIEGVTGFIGRFTLELERKQGIQLSPMHRPEEDVEHYEEGARFDRVGLTRGTVNVAATLPEMLAIAETYNIMNYTIHELYTHTLAPLSAEVQKTVREFYNNKKNDEADKIFINTLAGLMGRGPVKDIRGEITPEKITTAVNAYNGGFGYPRVMGVTRRMDQRWAAYMNSWVRLKMIVAAKRLVEVGATVIYADTDCIKTTGDSEKIAAVYEKMNTRIANEFGDSGIGQWGDESDEYTGGARFYGKRFYVKSDGTEITPVLAGFDTEASKELLNSFTMEELTVYHTAAMSRWIISRENKPKHQLMLVELGVNRSE